MRDGPVDPLALRLVYQHVQHEHGLRVDRRGIRMHHDVPHGDDAVQRLVRQPVVGQQQLRNVRQRLFRRNDVPGRHVRLHVSADGLQRHLLFDSKRPAALWGELHGVPASASQRNGYLQRRLLRNDLQRRLQRLRRQHAVRL
jgi:hypothetical protein